MAVWGSISGQSSPMVATLDGTTKMLSANTARSSNGTELIYFASGLDPNKEHTLILYNNPSLQSVGGNQSSLAYRSILSVSSATCASGVSLWVKNFVIMTASSKLLLIIEDTWTQHIGKWSSQRIWSSQQKLMIYLPLQERDYHSMPHSYCYSCFCVLYVVVLL